MAFLRHPKSPEKPVHVNSYTRYRYNREEYVREHYRRLPHQYDWINNLII